ncbi:MAG: hypothetical protein IIC39_05200 [Candidatus Marinimicrobia bacterium]|nr:hypothetical protein [Candidatus Neomarinimicrobiota bacterium]
MLHIAHLKWLDIENHFRFSLNNYGDLSQLNTNIKTYNSKIYLRTMTINNFFEKYLISTRLFPRRDKTIYLDNLERRDEVFAFTIGDSIIGDDLELGIKFLTKSLQLAGFSHLELGNQFLIENDNTSELYNKGELIHSVGEDYFYSHKEHVSEQYFNNLSKNTRIEFGKFFNLFLKNWHGLVSSSPLNIAFSHFLRSLERLKLEEQILHIVIGLEALLSPRGSELSHRVSQNASVLLGRNSIERENVYNLVRFGYDVRSNLAHGDSTDFANIKSFKKIKKSPDECVQRLRNIIRDAILRLLILDRSKDIMLKDLLINTLHFDNSLNKVSKNSFYSHLF